VDTTDLNGRRDARGRFLRVYDATPSPVRVIAPVEYGQWVFSRWTDRFGRDLPGGPHTAPVFDVALSSDTTLAAQYAPKAAASPRLNSPVVEGGMLTLEWNSQPGLRLRMRSDLSLGEWQEVPGSLGQSRVELPVTDRTTFFRLGP